MGAARHNQIPQIGDEAAKGCGEAPRAHVDWRHAALLDRRTAAAETGNDKRCFRASHEAMRSRRRDLRLDPNLNWRP
jgi:hypothetical protein